MFIIKSTKSDSILGNDDEVRPSFCFGPLKLQPKLYKTRRGAERRTQDNPWWKVVELDQHGCEITQ
jgi:hypothetical protein